jgi:hypothetical protein
VKCPQIRITVVEGIYYYEKKPDRPVEYDGLNGICLFSCLRQFLWTQAEARSPCAPSSRSARRRYTSVPAALSGAGRRRDIAWLRAGGRPVCVCSAPVFVEETETAAGRKVCCGFTSTPPSCSRDVPAVQRQDHTDGYGDEPSTTTTTSSPP